MRTSDESAFSGEPPRHRPAPPSSAEESVRKPASRIPVLDGWRALSILLVLAAHLTPIPPKAWRLNEVAGATGMALFFTLSGFLIVQFLAGGMGISEFLARRLARIIPLSWAVIAGLLLWHHYDWITAARNFLFLANIVPLAFLFGGEHLWSLGVEMQFYVCVALICLVLGRRGLYLIPVMALAVTAARIAAGPDGYISIYTWHRMDEILAGGIISLVYAGWFGQRALYVMKRLPVWPFAIAFIICSDPFTGPLQYLRPYMAALLVGSSLGDCPERLRRVLASRPLAYVAETSYAIYVFHGVLWHTPLWGSDNKVFRYLVQTPVVVALTFGLAHLSTRYYEQPITRRVRQLTSKWKQAGLYRATGSGRAAPL